MMFRIEYEVRKSLPPLAWLATVMKKTGTVRVICGERVECFEDFFVAGAWNGEFEKQEFDTAEIFVGTGAKLHENGISFVTPSHSLERLVMAENGDMITFSNSVPFLMCVNDYALDRRIDQYETIMCSMLDGPDKMRSEIPLADGKTMKQFIVSIITVTPDGGIRVARRQKMQPFTDFEEYYSRLMAAMKSLRDNSRSKHRKRGGYGLITTFSSGYDSLTASCIAKELGCEKALTLSEGKYVMDDGTRAARQLGYEQIEPFSMYNYRDAAGYVDAEFLSSGEMGTMLQFQVFEERFHNNLVFFGLRGSYWEKVMDMTDDFEMIGYYNCETDVSITENALRNGYLVVPLPTYGASVASSINRISNSDEMKPWSLRENYDKPIPRRILETHGVSRDAFGLRKYGGGFSLNRDNKARLSHRMSKEGYREFCDFCKTKKGVAHTPRRFVHRIVYTVLNMQGYFNYVYAKLKLPIFIKQKPYRHISNPGIVANLFFWGVDVMKKRYADALKRV